MSERLLGCIPSFVQEEEARRMGVPSDKEQIEQLATPWNATETPRIIEWNSDWESFLKEEADAKDLMRKHNRFPTPWELCERFCGMSFADLLKTTQKRNDCAAWATTRAAIVMALNQRWFGAERDIEAYNPTGIYAYSSGSTPRAGSYFADNGRTIYGIAKTACETGNFPVDVIGEYNGITWFTEQMIQSVPVAEKNQTGFAYVSEMGADRKTDVVILSLRSGRPVVIGNDIALRDGCRQDANGMYITDVGGGWGGGHATCAIDYRKVNDTEYIYIVNSHGNIYNSGTSIPAFGAYITKAGLKRYLSGSFSDIMPVTYTERPLGKENFNLNPEGANNG